MKPPEIPTHPAHPEPTAKRRHPIWLCVVINQLAFPGLGTILAGRRVGYPQAVVMVTGFVLTMGYMLLYLAAVVRYIQDPASSTAEYQTLYQAHLWALVSGTALCVLAWVWSLFSSLSMWREHEKAGPKTDVP